MGRAGFFGPISLILLCGLVYLPSVRGGFVYDDHRFVRLNPAVFSGGPPGSYFTDPATQCADDSFGGLYRPLRTLSFRAVALLSEAPPAHRIVSLLIHLANGVLLYFLLLRILREGSNLPCLIGALAFLLHPLATESVAWISCRGDLLALTGILGGLVFYLAPWRGARLLSLLCFALGVLSKESAAVFPLLLVVVDGYRFGFRGIRGRLVAFLPYLFVLALYLGLRFLALGSGGFGQGDGLGLTGGDLLASVLGGEAYYVLATIFPWWLTFELDLSATAVPATVGFFLVVGILLVAGGMRNSARPVTLAILWFLVALIPVTVLQFAFPLKIEVANRFAYPALVAFGILVAFISTRRRSALALSTLLLVAFVPLSVARAGAWQDEGTLWRDVLSAQPGNSRAMYGLGVVELGEGHPGKAREYLRSAAFSNPDDPKLATYLGRACRELASGCPEGSPEFVKYLNEARTAYQAAVVSWARGTRSDRVLFRTVALEAAWLSMIAGDPDLAARNAEIMLQADGELVRSGRTIRHLRELSRFLMDIRRDDLAVVLEAQADAMQDGGAK